MPNIEKKLFAEEEHSETRKGSSYGDQTGMFLKMDEDGKITYVKAVSYTHLDVYKRQRQYRRRRHGRCVSG